MFRFRMAEKNNNKQTNKQTKTKTKNKQNKTKQNKTKQKNNSFCKKSRDQNWKNHFPNGIF